MRCGVVWSGCGVLVFDCTFCGIDQMYVLEERSCKTCDIPRGCPGGNNNGNFFYVNRALRSMSLHDWCCWRHASTFTTCDEFHKGRDTISLCPKTILQSSNVSDEEPPGLANQARWATPVDAPQLCLLSTVRWSAVVLQGCQSAGKMATRPRGSCCQLGHSKGASLMSMLC